MISVGTKEFVLHEASGFHGPIRKFACPRCKRKKGERCVRPGGYQEVRTHQDREALWRDYCAEAPTRLAWLEGMALPWFQHVIEEYLIAGKRSKRRKIDIAIAQRRLEEARLVLEEKP